MSKVKLYTVTDITNNTVIYKNKPILSFKDELEVDPRQLAYCANNNLLIDNKYKIVCTGRTDKDYQYYKDLRDLMQEWDRTMKMIRRKLEVGRN